MEQPKTKHKIWLLSIEAQAKEKTSIIEELEAYQATLLKSVDFCFVATIIHDKDFKDNGEARKSHAHAFFELEDTKTLKQTLTLLKTALNCNEEQLSLEPTNSDILGVQYLTHKNQPQKAQYDFEKIKTNNNELLIARYSKTYQKPQSEEELLKEAFENSKTLWDFTQKVGFQQANKYRSMFNQIKQEKKENFEAIASERDKYLNGLDKAIYQLRKLIDLWRKGSLLERDIQEAEDSLIEIEDLPF